MLEILFKECNQGMFQLTMNTLDFDNYNKIAFG